MYFFILLLCILVPSLLLRCLNSLLGRSPTADFQADSTNIPTPPSSPVTQKLEHENVPAPDPSSSSKLAHEKLPAADSPKFQIRPSSSSSSYVSEPHQEVPTNSTNAQAQLGPSSSSRSSPFNLEDDEVLVNSNTPAAPSSSISSSSLEHDVFLSFRGKDTRFTFIEHLHACMNEFKYGIKTYRDTENLRKGRPISDLLTAIEESDFAVVVLSTNYAGSTWCLRELAHILECKKLSGMEVLPVFYRVSPAEIKHQIGDSADQTGDSVDQTEDSAHPTGDFAKAFAKHENRVKKNKEKKENVDEWRKALNEVAGLSGWHVTGKSSERQVILELAKVVSKAVRLPIPKKHLVGMEARIKEVESRLNLGSNDVLTIGIWGMGGTGKTTLAEEVFKKIREQFHPCGFVSRVGLQPQVEVQRLLCQSFSGDGEIIIGSVEKGIKLLRKALFKKKVLIVLDDVNNFRQIECLAPGGPLGQDFWGGGSRLIITTRDKSTLRDFNVQENEIYEIEKLNRTEAFELLCHRAFKKGNPPDQFKKLSYSFLKYAGGFPLALEVLGSYLSRHKVDKWPKILHKLDVDKDPDIFSVLQVSYDGLLDTDKEIFLDIACFFNGEDYVRVKKIWKGCGFSSIYLNISNLINKSLIKIGSNNELWMHDLLRCLGWHIVHEERIPRNRSRLWLDDNAQNYEGRISWRFEDARNVLEKNTGPSAVRGLFLSLPKKEKMRMMNGDPLLNMRDLRLLKICNVNFQNVDFTNLPPDLRLLEWHECPLESLSSGFQSDKLVEFKMPNSRIKQLWNEALSLRMLVLMDLSNCQYLVTTPDFSKVPKLRRLILEGCEELSKVHPTIGDLQLLVLLNLKGCVSLESLPPSISMRSLRTFILSGCSKLREFPEIMGNMKTLSELYLDGTAIRELPVSIQHLEGLILLNLSGCKKLSSLPNVLCSSCTSLKFLYLSWCSSIDKLPENIGCLKHLQELDACETAIRKVPESISVLKNLKLMCFHGCSESTVLQLPNSFSGLSSLTTLNLGGCNLKEGAIPDDIDYLFSLQSLDLSGNNFLSIPESISRLSELKEISLLGCGKLQSLPQNPPENVEKVDVRGCIMLTTSYVWKRLASRNSLSILNCRKPEEDELFPELHKFALEKLIELDLSNCQHFSRIPDMKEVPNIEVLILSGCSNLKEFPEISGDSGDMNNLSELHLDGTALKGLPKSLQQLEGLVLLNLSGCKNLLTIPHLLSLKSLNLSGCSLFSKLPINLGSWAHLQELDASETAITTVPRSILLLKNLRVLSFRGCRGLQLHDWFSELSSLTSLNLRSCDLGEVLVRDIICRLSSLQQLDLSENNFVSIPNEIGCLSALKRLDLSENNFVGLPESISQLSELTELGLSRSSRLQSLPENLPINVKQVNARDCPMLPKYATLTIWDSDGSFCFIYSGNTDQDGDQPTHVPLPVPGDGIELLFRRCIEDRICRKEPFELRFPHSTRIPNLWSCWRSGPCVEIPIDSNNTWMGFALFVVFEILQKDNFDISWELEETICDFYTHVGLENSLVFQNFMNFRVGSSYGLCCYEPRSGRFGGLLDKASPLLRALVSTKRPDIIVRGCGIHLISQEDAAKFVQNLTYETVTQCMNFNFGGHCEKILYETTTCDDLMELGSTPIVNQNSYSKRNFNMQPRGELSLYEGGREKSFRLCFPAPIISIPPWFFNHCAGDVTLCHITENLLDDQTWVGLELYVIFTWRTSASKYGNNSFFFNVDFCAYDHETIKIHRTLKIDSCLGTSDQLVVVHVPRVHFQQQLNQCQGISALFRTINPEMEVQVCGSRLVFEKDMEDLINSFTQICMVEDPLHETQSADQRNVVKGEIPVNCDSSFQRIIVKVPEKAPTSSIMRLQNYKCYLQQKQGSVEFNPILVHSKSCLLENRDSNQANVAEEDIQSVFDRHHLSIMVETLVYGRYSLQQWKRCLELLLQYPKVATLSFNGHTMSDLNPFNSSSTYNIYCSSKGIPVWFRRQTSYSSQVRTKIPPKVCDDNNWSGLVICAAFKVNQRPTTSMVKLLCHLRSKDYCLNPIPMCSITREKFQLFHIGGFIWLTYIPRVLLTELNVVSNVEARFYINCPGLKVEECGIRLLYREEEEEFKKVITDWWISFFDNLPLIRQLVEAKNNGGESHQLPMLIERHFKDFDRDLIYNATPSSHQIPKWFEPYPDDWPTNLEFRLPEPSPFSNKNWIGLALCSTYCDRDVTNDENCSYFFHCRLWTANNSSSLIHGYEMTTEESKSLKYYHPRGGFIWLSYIPRSWFLHQLNGESVLFASFGDGDWTSKRGALRFVYKHDVEEFKQLCINLHRPCLASRAGHLSPTLTGLFDRAQFFL